jgi:hypothetical protein
MSSEVKGNQELKAATLNNGLKNGWQVHSAMSSSHVTYICYARGSLLCSRGSGIHFFLNSELVVTHLNSKETWCKTDTYLCYVVGRDGSVGIATHYGLDGAGIESRWRRRYFPPVQTGHEIHPASYTMGTGSFPG